ncbi:hypothetical protein N1F78_09070 [Seonamhaeicola sp. MEBiC1930]
MESIYKLVTFDVENEPALERKPLFSDHKLTFVFENLKLLRHISSK